MAKAAVKRVALLLATLLLVTLLAYAAFSVIPGDPTHTILGLDATEEQIAALRKELGLDLPVWQRYVNYGAGLLPFSSTHQQGWKI